MKEPVLVIIKPDGLSKGLIGPIFTKFTQAKLEIIGIKILKSKRELIEEHYTQLRGEPYFDEVIDYLLGGAYKCKKLLALVYYGEDSIKKCRAIAGATNPELAQPMTVRGSFGRIKTDGLFENVVHVSSNKREAKREIQLWFNPGEMIREIFPTKPATATQVREWK